MYGCSPQTLSDPTEYEKVISKSEEISSVKTFEGTIYSMKYLPAEVLAIRNSRISGVFNKKKYNEELIKLNQGVYFNLIISGEEGNSKVKNKIMDKRKYMESLAYINSELQNNFRIIIDNRDTLFCSLSHFEAPSSFKPEFRFFLAFDLQNKLITDEMTLTFNDELLGSGPVKFSFEKTSIESLPKFKTL